MKHQWLAYVVVAILSIGAGVAIAGMPDSVPQSETIIPPSTTVAPEPIVASTTVPADRTTEPADTEPSDTEPTDTEPTDTEPTDTSITTIGALPERAAVAVAVANGSGRVGAAVENRDMLVGLGYADVPALNADEIVDATIVYYAPGNDAVAERMAADLGLPPEAVAPIAAAPGVQDLDIVQLLVYVGADRA